LQIEKAIIRIILRKVWKLEFLPGERLNIFLATLSLSVLQKSIFYELPFLLYLFSFLTPPLSSVFLCEQRKVLSSYESLVLSLVWQPLQVSYQSAFAFSPRRKILWRFKRFFFVRSKLMNIRFHLVITTFNF
jgi:hypothetical protein